MKRWKHWLLSAVILPVLVSGCAESTPGTSDTSTDSTTAASVTDALPLYENVEQVNLVCDDDESLNKAFVENWLEQYRDEQRSILLTDSLERVRIQCRVTDEMMDILNIDEWKEAAISADDEAYISQKEYKVPIDHDPQKHSDGNEEYMYVQHYADEHAEGYYVLQIGKEYAAIELNVMVPFRYENGVLGETSQTQGIRIWELPQDEPGDIVSALAAYGESLPSL